VRLDGRHGGDGLLAGGRGAGFIAQHLEDVAERIEHGWLIVYQSAVTAPSATKSASRSVRGDAHVDVVAASGRQLLLLRAEIAAIMTAFRHTGSRSGRACLTRHRAAPMLRGPRGRRFAMVTAAPFVRIRIGELVRRRIDPADTPRVGRVGGLVFGDQNLALVRWPGARSTFEPEDTLVEVWRPRR